MKLLEKIEKMSAVQFRLAVLGVLAGYAVLVTTTLSVLGITLPAIYLGNMLAMSIMIAIVSPDLQDSVANAVPFWAAISTVLVIAGLSAFNVWQPLFILVMVGLILPRFNRRAPEALSVRADGKPTSLGQLPYLLRQAAKGKLR